ncbi:MAG: hypothetical protein M0P66_14510 [Salinivirgaceae bacterium]|nr:hypothetical protein [Salinivirgaceae bacterium]
MKYEIEIMKSLFRLLWLQSDNCKLPIQNMGYNLMEVGKFTGRTRDIIKHYLDYLIDQGFMELVSEKPLLYQFTDKGRLIKSMDDIEKIINNVA